MYVGAYETSGFKSFVFGFFPAIRFFPHVYSRYAFFLLSPQFACYFLSSYYGQGTRVVTIKPEKAKFVLWSLLPEQRRRKNGKFQIKVVQ